MPPTNTYYLRNDATWLKATALVGPWTPAGALPESFRKIPATDDNWKDVVLNLPGKPITHVPKVDVTTKPAELILFDGEPKYVPVPGTKLLWISNTESDVFRYGARPDRVFYLVAGRWFSAPECQRNGIGPLRPPNLPEDFKKILIRASAFACAGVGARNGSGCGSSSARARCPRLPEVNKTEIKAPEVIYQGEPKFEPIPGTQLQRAVNTDKEIIKAGESYYMCYQGVWFISTNADRDRGLWLTEVPPEIYQIPASSPSHSVTYVTVEQSSPSTVTYAAYGGYMGNDGRLGLRRLGHRLVLPALLLVRRLLSRATTRILELMVMAPGTTLTPESTGLPDESMVHTAALAIGARYNPSTGTYARGAMAYGPYGARGAAQAYNPRTGNYAQTRQGSVVCTEVGARLRYRRGDDWASTKRFHEQRR